MLNSFKTNSGNILSSRANRVSLDAAEHEGGSMTTEYSSELGIKYVVGSRGSEVIPLMDDVSFGSTWNPLGMGGATGGTDRRNVGGDITLVNTLRK